MTTPTRVLHLSSARPDPDALGGVAVHVAVLCLDAPESVTSFTAYPSGDELLVEEWAPRRLIAALPARTDDERARAIAAALAGTRAAVLHVHSPELGADVLVSALRASGASGARAAVTLHDHSLVCENYELLEGGSRYCGIPMDPTRCDRCLATTRGRPPGALDAYRSAAARLVDATDVFVAPSRSVEEHASRVHPSLPARTRRIAWGVGAARARRERAAEQGPLRVAIIGVFAKVKGAAVLPALLGACRHLDVEWHLFGATEGASLAEVKRSGGRVVAHGAYRREALALRLVRARCHVAALPSVGAETFSLVLSEVTAAGFPVLASDLGALGERVREDGLGWVFDPFAPSTFAEAVAHLATARDELERVATHVGSLERRSEVTMATEHAALWAELAARGPRRRDADGSARNADTNSGATDALGLFELGVRRARERRPSRLDALFAYLKKTEFYRDLRLRRLLPEATRKTVEQALRRPSYRARRAKDRG